MNLFREGKSEEERKADNERAWVSGKQRECEISFMISGYTDRLSLLLSEMVLATKARY